MGVKMSKKKKGQKSLVPVIAVAAAVVGVILLSKQAEAAPSTRERIVIAWQ